jgi:hypothetical protein
MFKKVSKEEIEDIKKRLKSELEDKNLTFQRKEEVESLITHLDTWLFWKDYRKQKRYRDIFQSES